jgi:hypothetical protein
MEPILVSAENLDNYSDEELLVHAWCTEQLQGLGLPRIVAESFAALVDWHAVAGLVARGCSPELALEIVR